MQQLTFASFHREIDQFRFHLGFFKSENKIHIFKKWIEINKNSWKNDENKFDNNDDAWAQIWQIGKLLK